MTPKELSDALNARFPGGGAIVETKPDILQPWIRLAPDRVREVCDALRDDPRFQFDYLMCLSGVDYNGGNLGVVYHLFSTIHKHKIVLRASCTKDQPHVQSVSDIWRTAEWHEREAYDMFGIVFDGNKDLRRILLPDDWEGHPLRKDYKVPEFYQGIKVPY